MPKAWRKIALLKMAIEMLGKFGEKTKLKRNVWILWLDPTSLVTNEEFRVESIVDGPAGTGTLLVGQDAQVFSFCFLKLF